MKSNTEDQENPYEANIDPQDMNENELFKLLDIPPNSTDTQIVQHINDLIAIQEDPNMITFLKKSKDILTSSLPSISEQSFQEEYLNEKESNNIQVLKSAQIPTSNPADSTTYSVQVEEGTKNPRFIEKHKFYILINSALRANPLTSPSSTFTLDISLKKVLSIRLSSIKIPPSWYSFDDNFANTSFSVTNGIDDPSCIHIEPGNYDASGLITEINDKLTFQGVDASFSYKESNNKVTLLTGTDLSFIFYDTNNMCDPSACLNIYSKANNNLGYFLGFRGPPSATAATGQENAIITNNNFIIEAFNGEPILALSQLNLNKKINIILSIDDYNNNVFAEKIRLVEKKDNNLKLPSYYNADISCNLVNINKSTYSPAPNRPTG